MQISYLGLNCFKIQTKSSLLVTDPYSNQVGINMPRFKADIVTISDNNNNQANNTKAIINPQIIINKPGEYEHTNTFIYGVETNGNGNKNIIYLIEDEDIFLAHLGFINSELTDKQLESMKSIDVLFLPATGILTDKLSKIVSQIEPKIVIPMNYKIPKLKTKTENLEKIKKILGAKNAEEINKLKISKKDLPAEETKLITIKPEM